MQTRGTGTRGLTFSRDLVRGQRSSWPGLHHHRGNALAALNGSVRVRLPVTARDVLERKRFLVPPCPSLRRLVESDDIRKPMRRQVTILRSRTSLHGKPVPLVSSEVEHPPSGREVGESKTPRATKAQRKRVLRRPSGEADTLSQACRAYQAGVPNRGRRRDTSSVLPFFHTAIWLSGTRPSVCRTYRVEMARLWPCSAVG